MDIQTRNARGAAQQVSDLLQQICVIARNPEIERRTYEIEAVCRAFMEPNQNINRPKGVNVHLPAGEARALELLVARRGQTVSKSAIMDVMPHLGDGTPGEKLVDVRLCLLRKKLIGSPFHNMIETVWGIGFRLRTESEGPIVPKPLNGSRTNAAKFYYHAAA